MPLNKAQLMDVPGGPGVTGSVKAGSGISISPDGTISASGDGSMPPGTVTSFYMAAAPTGWTQNTSLNDYAIRLVSTGGGSTGGTQAFSAAFTSFTPSGSVSSNGTCVPQGSVSLSGLSVSGITVNGSVGGTSLSEAQIASHAHGFVGSKYNNQSINANGSSNANDGSQNYTTANAGGNGSHSHSFSGTASGGSISGSGSFVGGTTSLSITSTFSGAASTQFAVRYANFIIATKN